LSSFQPAPNPVISTGAIHSTIVNRAVEKSASLPVPNPNQDALAIVCSRSFKNDALASATFVALAAPECYVTSAKTIQLWLQQAAQELPQRTIPMVHDLVLALVFLGMIIAPALLAMRSGREEKDSL
jgi:hypothetical protein